MIELTQWPSLTDPVMIAAFEGWNDAGEAATSALEHLARVWGAEPFAALDPEDYYDFQVNRPTVARDADGTRRITWPTTRSAGRPRAGAGPRRRPGRRDRAVDALAVLRHRAARSG